MNTDGAVIRDLSRKARIVSQITPDQPGDSRFTVGLLADVFRLLEEHGYRPPLDGTTMHHRSVARSMVALRTLAIAFEGGDQ